MALSSSSCCCNAASIAAAIPFHCIICFDEFNFEDRPPVVLPCGHTYVCAPCSKRLSKCMECRQPLCWQAKKQQQPRQRQRQQDKFGSLGLGTSPSRKRTTLPEPSPADQVPMPKNLVLMSLMEAAQRVKVAAVSEEDDDDEMDQVVSGIQALSGVCGTYAVKAERGLVVLPQHPLVRRRKNSNVLEESEYFDQKEAFRIQKGQTVQVVGLEDGVFRLARDEGYIVATRHQLVKVGGPKETCCQLEGMLDLVELRKTENVKKTQELDNMYSDIEQRIRDEKLKEPTHAVITPAPEEQLKEPTRAVVTPTPDYPMACWSMEEDVCNENCHASRRSDQSCTRPKTPPTLNGRTSPAPFLTPRTPQRLESDRSLSSVTDMMSRCSRRLVQWGQENENLTYTPPPPPPQNMMDPLTPRTIDNLEICQFQNHCENNTGVGISCSSSLQVFREQQQGSHDKRLRSLSLPASPSMTSSSFDSSSGSIDWRTGMSGHRALLSVKIGTTPMYRGEIRMMSEHNGISRVRRPGRRSHTAMGY